MHVSRSTAAALAVVLTVLAAPAADADPALPVGVQVIAHRGFSATAPESTLAAMDQAVAAGSDRVSIDVRLTRDGVPVVVHDLDLARTTDAEQKLPALSTWRVGDLTLAQVKTLDAGSWFGSGLFTGAQVLTLDELLRDLGPSQVGMTLEVKEPSLYGGAPGIGSAVGQVLGAHPEWTALRTDGSPRVVVESFDWGFLDGMHTADPQLPLSLLGYYVRSADITNRPWVREIDVGHETLSAETIQQARSLGIFVGTWTANTSGDLQRAIDLGASGVTTDQPTLLRSLVSSEGRTATSTVRATAPPTTKVDISASATAPVGGRVPVTTKPRGGNGVGVPWQTVTFQSRLGGVWRTVGSTATDVNGAATLSLPVDETMRVRVLSGGSTSTERGIAAVVPPVVPPAGAPRPALRLAEQARPATTGADPRVGYVATATWKAMAGRTWRSGCPVGRTKLRTLQVSYWGFDGFRHRGTLVVARTSVAQLSRVFTRLYAQRLPIRSLRRLETMGGWSTAVGRALQADAGFGYACQRVPGDRTKVGSHARGTIVTVNPWENPAKVGGRGTPDTWWLSRGRSMPYVHTAANPVVRAFSAEGFAWNGRYGKYADFRNVR
ncbi:MAG: glycerophosphodiester phosphodiesterase family protein [Nocardioidaceae bacterium]